MPPNRPSPCCPDDKRRRVTGTLSSRSRTEPQGLFEALHNSQGWRACPQLDVLLCSKGNAPARKSNLREVHHSDIRPLRAEAHFKSDVRETGRALECPNGHDIAEVIVQIGRGLSALTPLESAVRAELEGHAEGALEGQHHGLRE